MHLLKLIIYSHMSKKFDVDIISLIFPGLIHSVIEISDTNIRSFFTPKALPTIIPAFPTSDLPGSKINSTSSLSKFLKH